MGESMLKKLTAAGIVAAAATGVMLLGGTANADRVSTGRAIVADGCYYQAGYTQPAWCRDDPQGYYQHDYDHDRDRGRWDRDRDRDRWNRWHHVWNRYQFHPHR